MTRLTHLDEQGRAWMVDVSEKKPQFRVAVAEGRIDLAPETLSLIQENRIAKGNVLGVAQVAGIQAAKQTSALIPLCHPLRLTKVDVDLDLEDTGIRAASRVSCIDRTGVEMEALTAVSVSLLAVYDMCKAVDKQMCIHGIRLVEKRKEFLDEDSNPSVMG